ncbi:MAG: thiamine-phosphate kinase [Alphaproteobacteria bacterium]|nr:thiamine-phosphate kinase [Alphaproteobacteria bacterium]
MTSGSPSSTPPAAPVSLGEFGRIRRFFAPLTGPAALGLADDAAVLQAPPDGRLAITTDTLVAGVHYVGDELPEMVARKALRVNLSDLAAMGAEPIGYTLSLALPRSVDDSWVAAFAYGLHEDQRRFGLELLGGDSVSTAGPVTITITALGRLDGPALTRSGAKAGDLICVSGTIGDGALGLEVAMGREAWPSDVAEALHDRYLLPHPRLGLGRALVGIASAAMDVSDGLLQDLHHILEASEVGGVVQAGAVPLSSAAQWVVDSDQERWLPRILAGGDDYELLFTVSPDRLDMVNMVADRLTMAVSAIGTIVADSGLRVQAADGTDLELKQWGFRHF